MKNKPGRSSTTAPRDSVSASGNRAGVLPSESAPPILSDGTFIPAASGGIFTASNKIADGTVIGHVHLKVADIERSIQFYRDILGFEVTARMGDSAAFLSAGGYHHHIGLNTWESKDGTPPPAGHTGLYHFAILFPTRKDLANALKRLRDANYPLQGASDHGVSEAIYLTDPDGNGIELYVDRPKEQWPRAADGSLAMTSNILDLEALLAEAD